MAEIEIKYKLVAYVDDVIVYRNEFPDTMMLQEDGLRKAEHAVNNELQSLQAIEELMNEVEGE